MNIPATLEGNLTKDPEVRAGREAGRDWTLLRVAVDDREFRDGRWETTGTSYYDVRAFGHLGEQAARHLKTGDRIVASGEMQIGTYTDKDGVERTGVGLVSRNLGTSIRFAGREADADAAQPAPAASARVDRGADTGPVVPVEWPTAIPGGPDAAR